MGQIFVMYWKESGNHKSVIFFGLARIWIGFEWNFNAYCCGAAELLPHKKKLRYGWVILNEPQLICMKLGHYNFRHESRHANFRHFRVNKHIYCKSGNSIILSQKVKFHCTIFELPELQ